MKINDLIKDLQRMADIHGNIEVQLQDDPKPKIQEIIFALIDEDGEKLLGYFKTIDDINRYF